MAGKAVAAIRGVESEMVAWPSSFDKTGVHGVKTRGAWFIFACVGFASMKFDFFLDGIWGRRGSEESA